MATGVHPLPIVAVDPGISRLLLTSWDVHVPWPACVQSRKGVTAPADGGEFPTYTKIPPMLSSGGVVFTACTTVGFTCVVYGEFGCSVRLPDESTAYTLSSLSLLFTVRSTLLVTNSIVCAVELPGGVNVIALSAVGIRLNR
jgi:hypothetical protein